MLLVQFARRATPDVLSVFRQHNVVQFSDPVHAQILLLATYRRPRGRSSTLRFGSFTLGETSTESSSMTASTRAKRRSTLSFVTGSSRSGKMARTSSLRNCPLWRWRHTLGVDPLQKRQITCLFFRRHTIFVLVVDLSNEVSLHLHLAERATLPSPVLLYELLSSFCLRATKKVRFEQRERHLQKRQVKTFHTKKNISYPTRSET